jgi:protein ImuA
MERRFARTISVSKEIDLELPFHGLPLGCVHEAQSPGLANGIAFASLLSVRIPDPSGQKVYVAPDASFHSLGLLPYRVPPEQWIHVVARNSLDLAWTVLEALRCSKVSVVLAPVKSADLALCRRWQLAAEGSGATGFLLTDTAPKPSIASVVTRWQITSIPAPFGATFGEPHWAIDLVYCRGGRPAQWTAAWREERLEHRPPSRPLQRTALATANRLAV